MKSNWPRGSEWRKWDLHIHAPATKLADQFRHKGGEDRLWDEYCRRLEESDVKVFGITDYFSSDGYFATKRNFETRYCDSDKVFLCNIELRISEVVNRANEEVNLHLIFNTFEPDHETKISNFLQYLKTTKTAPGGRRVMAYELSGEQQFGAATTTRDYITEALVNTYGANADWLDYFLIATAANNDGIRADRGKLRKAQISDEIDKFSNLFFGNSGNTEYFRRSDRGEDKTESWEPKPVLSGCDAHSFSDLEQRLGRVMAGANGGRFEPTWIKSDPTFEGLRQIIFEPRNRVYIGESPALVERVRTNKTKYLDRLEISGIDGYAGTNGIWFTNERISLGKELVAIIGNKGSGKSAITDIIGLLGNSHNQRIDSQQKNSEELFSFLSKHKFLKRGYGNNFVGKLLWLDGSTDERVLNESTAITSPEKVEYLPQKYLERICANIADDEFRKTLNEVIFRYVPDSARYGKSSLDGLITYLAQQTEAEIQEAKAELRQVNELVVSIEKKLSREYKEEIEQKILVKQRELAAHASERPEEIPKPSEEESASDNSLRIEALTSSIDECRKAIDVLRADESRLVRDIEDLGQLRLAIQRWASRLDQVKHEFESVLESVELSFDAIVKLELDLRIIDNVVEKSNKRLNEIRDGLATEEDIRSRFSGHLNATEAIAQAKAQSLVCRQVILEQQRARLVDQETKPAREYQKYLVRIAKWRSKQNQILGHTEDPTQDSLNGLKKELDKTNSVYPRELLELKTRQVQTSTGILRKKLGLTRIYDQIKQSIDEEIARFRSDLGDYLISIEAGLRFDRSFLSDFLGFINQGKKGSFHGIDEGRDRLVEICDEVDNWEKEDQVFPALQHIVEALHVDKRESSEGGHERDIFSQMRNRGAVVNLYDYLFGFDYLQAKYDLKVDQKDLSELSPGERGGLLLIFYLILDKQDTPLIIDQPEDNLDNKTVYEILVRFIKQAKGRRQIILVTHNPNLAVVSDAEQIIHVSINKNKDYDFDFFAGSIESPRINRAVVDILEGTMPAFDNRRLKYRRQ